MAESGLEASITHLLSLFGVELDEGGGDEEVEKALLNGDVSEVMTKAREKLDEFSQKAEMVYDETGMTREEIEEYASSPANFTEEQWKALERVKEESRLFKERARNIIGEDHMKKVVEAEKTKGQQRFGKKRKHWTPI